MITINANTTKEPISLMGEMAGVCYGADTDSKIKNYKRGLNCLESGHWRTLEFPQIYFSIEGYSAKVIREFYTHIGGSPTRLQSSTRYVDYEEFDYVVPKTIKNNPAALSVYFGAMDDIIDAQSQLLNLGIPKEDSSYLLPLGMTSTICCGFNPRTIASMAEQRLCTRALWEYRDLIKELEKALREYSEEWNTLCNYIFVRKCDKLGHCPETESCGRYLKY